ncbi:MAG: response regulator [Candidatus Longimicrobiales bacterium M2_2A_002]
MAETQSSPAVRFFRELKRRRVFGSAAAYVVLAALLIELSGAIFEALLFPAWTARLVTVILILGFPVVVVLAWFFDISAGGLSRTDESTGDVPAGNEAGGLRAALQRAGAVPVPAEPVRRRRRAVEPAEEDTVSEPDDARVRAATLGHVRHELRTPINGIIGYAEMLVEDVDDPSIVEDLDRIRAAGRQLLDRVDAVLRPEGLSGTTPGELEAFGEKVRVDLRTPINAVVGYAEMVMETCDDEGLDHLLPDLERILTSARRLLELSEDIVRIATLGSEATAPASLAASSAATRQVLSKIRPGEAGVRDGEGRLLVIDDNETNRDLLSRQLARHGYAVATAEGGEAGLRRLEREDYDLILLDVIMPNMDGVEVLRRLQADERWSTIPVIMLSSLDEVDSAVRCIEMGALDYVAKPVQPTLLEARIAAALEIRELHRRERTYRKRVAADGALIGRLLGGAVPGPLRDRVAEGALEIVEPLPAVTAVRCVVAPELRPGTEDGDRVRALTALLARFEELTSDEVDICLWRPDGCLVVLGELDGRTGTGRAADLVLAAQRHIGDGRAAFGVHAAGALAGVLGRNRPRLEVWGEAVEVAEALARIASPGEVLVAPGVQGELRDSHVLQSRGVREVGGTQMRLHALVESGAAGGRGDGRPASDGAASEGAAGAGVPR